VEQSKVHALLGPNGAGKTTLLRALNGLERADGELFFEGRPVRSGADRLRLRRHTAAVFQQAYLLATTVRGNVESGLSMRGVKGEDVCPPGQSGFVAPDGTLSSHYQDQMDLYKNFQLKPMLFDRDDVMDNSGPPQTVNY